MSDPIADMLTRIRNAVRVEHLVVDIPGSRLKTEIARVLKMEGYVKGYKVIEDNKQGCLRVYIKLKASDKVGIVNIDRVSKPGRRVYQKAREIKSVYNGMGISILSTSKGVMTDKQAVKNNVGGEVLCNVW